MEAKENFCNSDSATLLKEMGFEAFEQDNLELSLDFFN